MLLLFSDGFSSHWESSEHISLLSIESEETISIYNQATWELKKQNNKKKKKNIAIKNLQLNAVKMFINDQVKVCLVN